MKKHIAIFAVIILSFANITYAEPLNTIEYQSSNIEDRQIGVSQDIIIELVFSGKINDNENKDSKGYRYELYKDNEKGTLSRVNMGVQSNRQSTNNNYTTVVNVKPDDPLEPLTSYVLVIKDEKTNSELKLNFRTKDNSKSHYTYALIIAVSLAALYIFKIKKEK